MKKYFLLCLVCLFSLSLDAKLVLPEIFSDNMVLQCRSAANIWGWASPNAKVTIKSSWNSKPISTLANADGYWVAAIPTGEPGFEKQTLSISEKGGNTLSLSNILLGEVWFAGGQSNMEMPLEGYGNCPTKGGSEEIAISGSYEGIRFCKVPITVSAEPQQSVPGKWMESNSNNAVRFSATGFFFAKHLYRTLNIPIGIIDCCRGGSSVESWMPHSQLQKYSDIAIDQLLNSPKSWNSSSAEIFYNAMLHPVAGYSSKGFIWYQGEANVGKPDYALRLKTMTEIWRSEWAERNSANKTEEMPFYIVEIAPWFGYSPEDDGRGISGALLREQQLKASKIIPNSGFVSTNDLVYPYETNQIHPCQKEEVGTRLAYLALNRTYGYREIACESPEFSSMRILPASEFKNVRHTAEDGTRIEPGKALGKCVEITFAYTEGRDPWFGGGLSPWHGIEGFEVAGEDRVFHSATAVLEGRKVITWSDEVPEPVAVRYGFRDWLPGNLKNGRGLPLIPFRTDNWE